MNTEASAPAAPTPNKAPSQPPITSAHCVQDAAERLQQSRRTMREQMLALNTAATHAHAAKQGARQRTGALLATLSALPLIGPWVDGVVSWWDSSPLRAVTELLASRETSSAKPGPQRQPWAMLATAVAAGALLMWWQPWRHRFLRRAVYAGVIPRLVASLLSRLSTDGWVKLAEDMLRRPAATPKHAAQASAPPGAPASPASPPPDAPPPLDGPPASRP